jgi:hypothetical protein
MRVGSYVGQTVPVDAQTRAALASADIASIKFLNPSGAIIDLTMIGGTDRSALHDPRSCLAGAGWRVNDDHVVQLTASGSMPAPARSCVATITDPASGAQSGYDILYLYVTHGCVIASATSIRLALLESALFGQNDAPVYFIRLMAPMVGGQGYAAEHSSLMHFASAFWTEIAPSIVKGESA